MRRRISVELPDPGRHGTRDIGVLGDIVTGTDESMGIRLRKPRLEIVEIEIREHRVRRPPQQEGRDVSELLQPGSHSVQRRCRGMVRLEGDVRDELRNGSAPLGRCVGGHVRITNIRRRPAPRHVGGAPHERRRLPCDGVEHRGRPSDPDDRGCRRSGGLMDSGVGQHDSRQQMAAALSPAERDRPAPVVGDCHHRAIEPDLVGQRNQIVDPLLQASSGTGSLGVAHVEVIGRNHSGSGRGAGEQVAPQIGPRRVPVHAQQRDGRIRFGVVQNVKGSS